MAFTNALGHNRLYLHGLDGGALAEMMFDLPGLAKTKVHASTVSSPKRRKPKLRHIRETQSRVLTFLNIADKWLT